MTPEREPPAMPSRDTLDALARIVGEEHAIRDADAMAPYLVEWRDRYVGKAALILKPGDTQEVAAILARAHATRTAIVPQGGNTGLVGGQIPFETGHEVVVSLSRLNRVRDIDLGGNTMTVEAGLVLAQAQQVAASAGRLFPLSLASEGSCQIGGVLATNAGGMSALAYGSARHLALGLEVVLADGQVWDGLKTLRKDNTGYDLKQWFIGAEGTLGIITGATLKLFPKPAAHATALIAVADLKAAVTLLGALRTTLAGSLTTFEVMPRLALELAIKHIAGVSDPLGSAQPWYVLAEIGLAGTADVHDGQFADTLNGLRESGEILDAVLASSETQRLALWHIRENIPAAQTREGASIKHDISLPIAAIPEFVATAGAAVLAIAPGARMVSYGHLGDGNLHFNFSPAPGAEAAEFLAKTEAIKRAVHDLVAERRGSFSAEHGIGKLKVGELARYENPVALDMMRLIKHSLDPHGIMNPGKVLPPPS